MAIQQSERRLPAQDYETIYILRPTTQAKDAESANARVTEIIEREQGKVTKVDVWGKRRLAYPIAKHSRGIFVYTRYLGRGGLVHELERNLRIMDEVIRYQTVRVGEGPELESVAVDPEELKYVAAEADSGDENLTPEQRLRIPEDTGGGRRRRDEARAAASDDGDDRSDSDRDSDNSDSETEEQQS